MRSRHLLINPGLGPVLKCAPGLGSMEDFSIIQSYWPKTGVVDFQNCNLGFWAIGARRHFFFESQQGDLFISTNSAQARWASHGRPRVQRYWATCIASPVRGSLKFIHQLGTPWSVSVVLPCWAFLLQWPVVRIHDQA